jgi:hypothetical protein
MTTKADKHFDCVEFRHRAQLRIYGAIKDLSPEQEIDYFRRAAAQGPLGIWWRSLHPREAASDAQTPGK